MASHGAQQEALRSGARAPLHLWLLTASVVGLFAALMLTLEKLSSLQQLAANGSSAPTLACDLNAVVSCGRVINEAQAALFGPIPNPVVGLVAWAVVLTLSVILLSGGELRKWHWLGLQAGVLGGVAIVTYLQYTSIYVLYALCPYCVVTWAVMIPTFWVVTSRNLRVYAPASRLARVVYEWTPTWIVAHFGVLLTLIFLQFGLSMFG